MMLKACDNRITLILLSCYTLLTVGMSGMVIHHTFMHGHKKDHEKQHFSITCHWMCTAAVGTHSADGTIIHHFEFIDEVITTHRAKTLFQLEVYSINNRSPPLYV